MVNYVNHELQGLRKMKTTSGMVVGTTWNVSLKHNFQNLKKKMQEFWTNTSIAGIANAGQARNIPRKNIWIVVFSVCAFL